jgi:hypothetical protein
MHAACAEWLARWNWQDQPGARLLTEDQLRELLRAGYLAGYEAGRTQRKPP